MSIILLYYSIIILALFTKSVAVSVIYIAYNAFSPPASLNLENITSIDAYCTIIMSFSHLLITKLFSRFIKSKPKMHTVWYYDTIQCAFN